MFLDVDLMFFGGVFLVGGDVVLSGKVNVVLLGIFLLIILFVFVVVFVVFWCY